MGSCLGKYSAAPPPKNTTSVDGGSKSPPPVYEETVKQVLSEIPLHPIPTFHYRENENVELKREKAKSDAKPGRGRPRSDSGSSKTGRRSPVKKGCHPGRADYGSGDRKEERIPPTNIELLESSLVSLECFIFL